MKIIAFHTQHDAALAVAEEGRLVLSLELERLFETRYFESSSEPATFTRQWEAALRAAQTFTRISSFDVAVTCWVPPWQRRILAHLVPARTWRQVDHHTAHALHGLHDSRLETPLILSFDGGGNDGTFRVFDGRRSENRVEAVERVPLNLGTPYRLLATAMPELTQRRAQPRAGHLSLAGKLMAYAALGTPNPCWRDALDEYYRCYQEPRQALHNLGNALGLDLDADQLGAEDARSLAATSQQVFTELVLEVLHRHLKASHDGVVLTGGCALNVVANEQVRRAVRLPVHVPPAPNDAGIAMGALWSASMPGTTMTPFAGLPLVHDVPSAVLRNAGGRAADLHEVSELIAQGAVVGVAHGRAEVGPRALGNRSLLANARAHQMRERINARIKKREWFRPVAPAVLERESGELLAEPVHSPYMSFAVATKPEAVASLPAAGHVDGSARVQTVLDDEPLGLILRRLRSRHGMSCILNTSFNVDGQPLLQRTSSALEILRTRDVDFVFIDGTLLPSPRRTRKSGTDA